MSAVEETHLVCLPFAGAGASFFTPWQDRAPEGLHVLPVRLPGREERFVEEPYTDAVRAAAEAHTQVTRQLPEGARVAVFGHSLGAVLGFERAYRLEAEPGVRLDALVVSGAPGPWSGRADRASGLPDAEFLARVRTFAGYAHPALEHPEMRELLLPLLRADVRMHETYRARLRPPARRPGPRPARPRRRAGERGRGARRGRSGWAGPDSPSDIWGGPS
jgi:surfactin synthase thioesterase subunit